MSRTEFTHFVRKVFARQSLPTGKLRLFRPLGNGNGNNEGSGNKIFGPDSAHQILTHKTFCPEVYFHKIFNLHLLPGPDFQASQNQTGLEKEDSYYLGYADLVESK